METTKKIIRKTMLYKTNVEYGDYTMNLAQGCAHGCKYPCYAFLSKKRFNITPTYDEWCNPAIVENTMELLNTELPRLNHKIHKVQLCFTTDPFMFGYDDIKELSIASIKKINQYGIPCSVLTKGILPEELSLCSIDNEYGITLVSLDENFRSKMEPGAAPINQRLDALEKLHNKGCKTWISMEPYPTENIIKQNLHGILERVCFVDKIIFGRMNYNKNVPKTKSTIEFYNDCANEVKCFCKNHDIEYYIKKGTIVEV